MRLFLWLAAGLILWTGVVALTANDVRDDVETAQGEIARLWEAGDGLDLEPADVAALLDRESRRLGRARASFDAGYMRPVAWIPVIGRQYRAARAMLAVSDDVVREASGLSAALVESDIETGAGRRSVLDEAERRLRRILELTDSPDLGPSDGLALPIADARNELSNALGDIAGHARSGVDVVGAVAAVVDGSSFLVLGANNAEMQAGAGMPLSIGRLDVTPAGAELTQFGAARELFPVQGVEASEEQRALWGFLEPTNDFRKLALSPRFDAVVAPTALEMWEAKTGERLDGVLLLDALIFDAVLAVTGPVTVDARTLANGSALEYLIADQYEEFGDLEDRDQRQDRLQELAVAVSDALAERAWDPIALVRALRPLVAAGHLKVYSVDPNEQRGWVALGADGGLEGGETGVFLLNLGASKLDPFIRVSVVATLEGDGRAVQLDVTVANETPAGLPEYVVGPWEAIGLPTRGTHLARLMIVVPGSAQELSLTPRSDLEVNGADGPVWILVTRIELQPGEVTTFRVSYRTAGSDLRLIPSARIPETSWTVNGSSIPDRWGAIENS